MWPKQTDNIARRLAQIAAACISLGAATVLVGWLADNPVLKCIVPGFEATNPMTAILFLLTAVVVCCLSLADSSRRAVYVARAFGAIIALVAASSAAGYLSGWSIGIDRAVFGWVTGENQIAPNTAATFLLLGLSIIVIRLGRQGRMAGQALVLMCLAGATMSLVGYCYGARGLFRIADYIPMALPTACLFAITSVGILAAQPDLEIVRTLLSPAMGGVMARRLLPAGIAVPIILGLLRVAGQRWGYYDSEFGTAMMTVATVVLLVGAVLLTATMLNRIDADRKAATDEVHRYAWEVERLNKDLEQRVADRTAELAEANRDLTQKNQENEMFVYSVSHDLRSPLVSLQGFSKELGVVGGELREMLDSDRVPTDIRARALTAIDGDMQQSLRFIQSAVMRLSSIIDALLRLSRIGRVEFRPERLDMDALVGRVIEACSGELYARNVDVRVNRLSPTHGDAAAIEQLLHNLIGNAVKYSAADRTPAIEIGELDASTAGGQRTLFVSDNGLGIAPTYLEKIFQPFKRVHPQVASGDGMGLAIVRRVVERHGGRVWVESTEGVGSTFFFTLPDGAACDRTKTCQRKGESHNEARANGDLVGGRR
jgi:signal transduction histidine kinase